MSGTYKIDNKEGISSEESEISFSSSDEESDIREWLAPDDSSVGSEESYEPEPKRRKSGHQVKYTIKKKEPIKKPEPKRTTAKDFILNKGEDLRSLEDLIIILDHKDAGKQQKLLIGALKELNNMVGMKYLKQQIVNQILYFIQGMHDPGAFLHTVITGPPGTGKTKIGRAHV